MKDRVYTIDVPHDLSLRRGDSLTVNVDTFNLAPRVSDTFTVDGKLPHSVTRALDDEAKMQLINKEAAHRLAIELLRHNAVKVDGAEKLIVEQCTLVRFKLTVLK